MSAEAAGLVQLADQAQRRAALYAGNSRDTVDGVPAVVEAINGLTYAVLALVAVMPEGVDQ